MKKDDFGDRMKAFEKHETVRKFLPTLPIIARIDGRKFSKFTKPFKKPFKKPFDNRISDAMRSTTRQLVEHTNACIGYCQSDEITLIFHNSHIGGEIFFNGKIHKLTSVLASMATAYFIRALDNELSTDAHFETDGRILGMVGNTLPNFDARVWQVPSQTEAANALLWRCMDAQKNGISSACRSMHSAKAMHGKNQSDMLDMMADKNVDYYKAYEQSDRVGTFFQRKTYEVKLSDDIWDAIPENQRRPENRVVTRSRVENLMLGPFKQYVNREAIIFNGATARTHW